MIERLEARRHLDASLDSGVLTVRGTGKSDRIIVSQAENWPYDVRVTRNGSNWGIFNGGMWGITIVVYGANGDDTIVVTDMIEIKNQRIYGDGGNDRIIGSTGTNQFFGGSGGDRITGSLGPDYIRGGSGADTLFGDEGDDFLYGEGGNDKLTGGRHGDVLSGGKGVDSVDFSANSEDIVVSLDGVKNDVHERQSAGFPGDGTCSCDTSRLYDVTYSDNVLDDIENVVGGSGDDRLIGSRHINRLIGSAGNDTLDGGLGDDLLQGGSGDDQSADENDDLID